MTDAEAAHISERLLTTAQLFADTCPELEGKVMEFAEQQEGENPTVRTMKVTVDGEPFLMICKRGA